VFTLYILPSLAAVSTDPPPLTHYRLLNHYLFSYENVFSAVTSAGDERL
jgi:hypothetical protein